ncbi:MFS transporter [Streptomyces mangrovisoli]|uniref:MFS transporter n=1 Tax=Streptomyces mangrovisoli TaxID=1428628 RepID=A0A1J4P0A4_9ACTN|nr:MFS transporter [Streptomyces mangrovisoli]OIJ68024.1 MFS transporter [Streptomyces mangrovisoli]
MTTPDSTPDRTPVTGDGSVAGPPRRRLAAYGLGSIGTGVFSTVPGLLLLYYMTDVLGVAAGLAGLVVTLPKAWDAFLNPMVGAASDREAVRTGRRTRLLLAGTLALPVAFAAMFLCPFTGAAAEAWVATTFVLAASAFSLFQVPYVALPAEMSDDSAARTRVMVWRIVFLTLGILVAGGLAPAVVDAAGGGRPGYAAMGATVAVIVAAVLAVATRGTRWVRSRPGPEPLGLAAAFRTARGNRAFFALLTAFVAQAAGVAVMLAAAPYVATYRLGSYGLTSALFVCLVAPSALAVPLWGRAAHRYGRLRCFTVATCGYAAGAAALLPAVAAGAVPAVLALCVLLGICYAALQVLPLALLPDTVLADAARTGHAQSGAFTGLWTAGETIGLAVGPGAYSLALAATGFVSSTLDHPVAQTSAARTGVLLGFSVVPAVLMLLSLPALRRYGKRRAAVSSPAPALAKDLL